MDDKSIFGLRKTFQRCKHFKIYRRKFGYNHHIFVGEADVSGCDIYHYSISLLPLLKMCPPAQIKKERLEYSSYMENKDIMKIFNWKNGDTVVVVDRDDYPESERAENECIAKAELRLGETNYSIAFNNCESYINWIFSGDNTSNEFRSSSPLTQITLNVLEECIYTGGSNLFLHLCSEILENVNDFVINKSVTNTIYFCDTNKNELFFTFLKLPTNFHCQQERKIFLMDRNISNKLLELPKLYNFECQKGRFKMLNTYSKNRNAHSSKIGSIKVYKTLSVRNCIFGFCSEKVIAVKDSLDPDYKVGKNTLSQVYQLDSPLVNWGTGIADLGSLERVQLETFTGSIGYSCRCSCNFHSNTASSFADFQITKGILDIMEIGQNAYMTNAQRIGSTARKGVALLTSASLQHNYDLKKCNIECIVVEKSCLSSMDEMIKDFKQEYARNALRDVSIDRGISNHLQTNFNCEQHNFSQLSCGFMNSTIIDFGNCPADICVPEAQCLIL